VEGKLLKFEMHMKFWMFIWILVFSSFYLDVFMLFDVYLDFGYLDFISTVVFWVMVWIIKFERNMLCMDV